MAKKKVSRKSASSKYTHFVVHGNHSSQKILMYILFDLAVSVAIGFMLQPIIVSLVTSYAAGGY